ncbi:MAG: nucleoside deaminase [Filifactor alocis]|nr:nucleoside deaminase [Filifactor alocis]
MDYYMEEAFREALQAYEDKEVPVGAVIIKDGEIIARAHNRIETRVDVTSHAEVMAIREAQKKMGNWRLTGAIMYVTLEPCLMCMGAILHSRISELHIGTRDEERGAAVSKIPVIADELLPNNLTVYLHEDETCKYLLQRFFRELRKTKR